VIALGLALLLQGATPARTAEGDRPRQPPVFEANVALVAVPVFVTDKAGQAVAGLRSEDFEVFDGGQRVEIAAFQAVDVDDLQAPDARLPVAVQAAMARQFLLLFDLQFSTPNGIARTRAAAARFVREALAPTDLVAVALFGRGGLKILTSFTTDREHVGRAIDSLGLVQGVEAAGDALGLTGGAFLMPSGAEGRAAIADAELAKQIDLLNQELKRGYMQRVIDFGSAIEDLARLLSSLRGRKQVVLFSGGFAESAWTGPAYGANQEHIVRGRLHDMFRAARESDVVIHSVDAGGLEGPVDVGSETGQNIARGVGRGALYGLANETGGRYIQPTNDFLRALREMDQASRRYYVLAFQPADRGAKGDKPRGLKVRVRRDGLKVSHRSAYRMPAAPAAPGTTQLVAAEAIAKGISSSSGLHLLAMPYRDAAGAPTIPVLLHLDPAALAALGQDKLQLQVYGYALADRQVLDSVSTDTTLDLGKVGAVLRSDGLRVLTTFAAAPGPVDVRFAVRAGGKGEITSIRQRVDVPAYAAGETVVSPPFLTLPLPGRVAVPLQSLNGGRLEIPFRLGGQPFLADQAPLQAQTPREVCVFVWPARTGAALEVTAEMTSPDRPAVPVRIDSPRVVRDADGFDRYVMTVVPPAAAPGSYRLRLTFRDAATGQVARSEGEVALRE
jgi:VWFA-related protein